MLFKSIFIFLFLLNSAHALDFDNDIYVNIPSKMAKELFGQGKKKANQYQKKVYSSKAKLSELIVTYEIADLTWNGSLLRCYQPTKKNNSSGRIKDAVARFLNNKIFKTSYCVLPGKRSLKEFPIDNVMPDVKDKKNLPLRINFSASDLFKNEKVGTKITDVQWNKSLFRCDRRTGLGGIVTPNSDAVSCNLAGADSLRETPRKNSAVIPGWSDASDEASYSDASGIGIP